MRKALLNTPGRRLRALRVSMGWKQQDLAEQLGLTQSHLSRIELDKSPINPIIVQAAELFGVTADYLLMRSNDPLGAAVGENDQSEKEEREEWKLLQVLIDEVPAHKRSDLIRFLVRQIGVYQDHVLRE